MKLTNRKCIPCEGNMKPLGKKDVNELLKEIPSWAVKEEHLLKQFKFRDFNEAIKFVNKIARIAEEEGHHPDIAISYNRVKIMLITHSISGLSENDFVVAAKIDGIKK